MPRGRLSTPDTRKSPSVASCACSDAGRRADLTPSLILLIVGAGIPVITTLASYLPFFNRLTAAVKPYIVYPAIVRGLHDQAIWRWFHLPNAGQSIYIFIFIALNVILSSVGYISVQPNTWWDTLKAEMLSKVAARTGILAMGLAPLVILFAGRNSVLLWATNWSHSTFLLLHRWVARLFGIQVILHSVLFLAEYVDQGDGAYETELVEQYWIWGCVATVAASIMILVSVFRASAYEWFLITHIILAVFVLAGTWYHLDYRFEDRWGYKYWLYACFAIWAFDRVVRIVRMCKNGMRKATFRPVGDEILRVDIEGVNWDTRPGQHAYVFFPALRKWTPWENHPFSVIPTHFLRPRSDKVPASSSSSSQSPAETPGQEKDAEHLTPSSSRLQGHTLNSSAIAGARSGITFFIRKNHGLTKYLWSGSTGSTTTLVEGPYAGTSSRPVLRCDRLLLIGGGIGITALAPFVPNHTNVKLYWSMRDEQAAMINEIRPMLQHVENEIVQGKRLDIAALLQREVGDGWKDVGVVVCGPGGMCDLVRQEVVKVSKASKIHIELDVEAFSW